MTVAIGCTGGKHRSVAMAEEIAGRLRDAGHRRRGGRTATSGGSDGDRAGTAVAVPSRSAAATACPRPCPRCATVVTDRDLTAVVTVADNGGSSGGCAASSACCRPATCGWRWRRCAATTSGAAPGREVLQHRFEGDGELHGHVVGNLLIVGLWELLGDPVDGLDWVGRLLGAHGRVLPMALDAAGHRRRGARARPRRDPTRSTTVRGQVEVATTRGAIDRRSRSSPPDPPACPEAVEAIRDADWVVLGPGLVVHLA